MGPPAPRLNARPLLTAAAAAVGAGGADGGPGSY